MSGPVLRRFIVLMFIAVLVVGTFTLFWDSLVNRPPGDYETEKGDMHLSMGEYEQALQWFDDALAAQPNHRGALMGRALVFIQQEQYDRAKAELTSLIDFLRRTVEPEDATGIGALAAAYANRGIVKDREGDYEGALADYVEALRVDDGAVDGPGLVDRVLHNPRPSTVRDRARYIHEQLRLPEADRVMRVPEQDQKQRMYKP